MISIKINAILVVNENDCENLCNLLIENSMSTINNVCYANEYYYIPYLFTELNNKFKNSLKDFLK